MEVLARVLEGGATVAAAAGAVVAGGHSVDDPEPKYGMSVMGVVHPDHLLRIDGARPGDVLVLTKPLGTGILSSAIKDGHLHDDAPEIKEMVKGMVTLNDTAASAAHDAGCRAATDVTGYGLLGHLREMLDASSCGAHLDVAAVPVLEGALALARRGVLPGGTRRNLEWVTPVVDAPDVDEAVLAVLADAQTSGGLLLAWPATAPGPPGPVIGVLNESHPGHIELR
jgi:selenide,water dikinase